MTSSATNAAVEALMLNIWKQIGSPELVADPKMPIGERFCGADMRAALEAGLAALTPLPASELVTVGIFWNYETALEWTFGPPMKGGEELVTRDQAEAREADLQRQLAAMKEERYQLAYAICGGEDAPGLLDSTPVDELVRLARENTSRHMSDIDRATGLETALKAAEAKLAAQGQEAVGELKYRPNKFDDWGMIRNADGSMFASVRRPASEEELAQHRVNKTDPYEDLARRLIASYAPQPDRSAGLDEAAVCAEQFRDKDWIAHDMRTGVFPERSKPVIAIAAAIRALKEQP